VAPNPNPNDFSIPLGCERTMMQTYAGLRDASSIGAATRVQVIQGFVYHEVEPPRALRRTAPPDFIAGPLHCVVRRFS
jgi:hypothetical protein